MAVIERMEATNLIVDQTREQIILIDKELQALKNQKEGLSPIRNSASEVIDTNATNLLLLETERDSLAQVYSQWLDEMSSFYVKAKYHSQENELIKKHYLVKYQRDLKSRLSKLDQIIGNKKQENTTEIQKQISDTNTSIAINDDLDNMILNTKKYKNLLLASVSKTKVSLKELQDEREAYNVRIEETIIAELSGKNLRSEAPQYTVYRGRSIANFKGKLPFPLSAAEITKKFGKQKHPTLSDIMVMNNGIDMSSIASADVMAVHDGKVITIMEIPGFDQLIILQHDNFYTVYSKVDDLRVRIDQEVSKGQILGKLTAENGKYDLHFEIWKGKQKLDPSQWLKN